MAKKKSKEELEAEAKAEEERLAGTYLYKYIPARQFGKNTIVSKIFSFRVFNTFSLISFYTIAEAKAEEERRAAAAAEAARKEAERIRLRNEGRIIY